MTLIGYWPLNEGSGDTAYDYSGNENHGSLEGSPEQGADGLLGGNSYSFDSSQEDYIVVDSLTESPWQAFTAVVWFKMDEQNDSEQIVGKHDGGEDGDWYISVREGGSRSIVINENSERVNCEFSEEFDNSYYNGEWHMVALVYSSERGEMINYWNGKRDSSCTQTGRLQNDPDPVSVGAIVRDSNDPYWFTNGKIKEFRLYNRALSPSEVQYLYNVSRRGRFTSRKKSP